MEIERLSRLEWGRLKRIRLAAPRDAPQAFGTTLVVMQTWADDAWRQQVEDLPTFVAKINDTDVGIARCKANFSNRDARLISMWVLPTARGKRVGEQLVEAVARWARDAGFTRLLLDVVDDNSAAIALYERLNFKPTGETSTFSPPRSQITEHRRAQTL